MELVQQKELIDELLNRGGQASEADMKKQDQNLILMKVEEPLSQRNLED